VLSKFFCEKIKDSFYGFTIIFSFSVFKNTKSSQKTPPVKFQIQTGFSDAPSNPALLNPTSTSSNLP